MAPSNITDDKYPTTPLTKDEIAYVRLIIETEKRQKWVWYNIRIGAQWIGAVIATVIVTKEWILKIFSTIVNGNH